MSSMIIFDRDAKEMLDYERIFRRFFRIFLITFATLIVSLSLRSHPNGLPFQPLKYGGASAHSNVALFALFNCTSDALRVKADREKQAIEKYQSEMKRLMNYGIVSGALVATGAVLTSGWLGLMTIPVSYYFVTWEGLISDAYNYEIQLANQYYERDEFECEAAAKKLDEELQYVDEAERNIHFEFGSGSIQYQFLDIYSVPQGSVTLEHIRGS